MAKGERSKFATIAEAEGFATIDDLLEAAVVDGVCPGICMICDWVSQVEPDQDRGWFEGCDSNAVKSALILAGLI